MRPVAAAVLTLLVLAGCGLDVASPDVFLITRAGLDSKLSLLVNNGGFARCNGGRTKTISSSQLISARDLSDNLTADATNGLTIAPTANTIYTYTIRMQQGTIRFPDVAAGSHKYLAQAELYFVQAMQGICGVSA
jgi:hypothetical protein